MTVPRTVSDPHNDLTADEVRALTEHMIVVDDDPACYNDCEVAVYSAHRRYIVNPIIGFCECPSDRYNPGPCKHRERVKFAHREKEIPCEMVLTHVDSTLLKRLALDSDGRSLEDE